MLLCDLKVGYDPIAVAPNADRATASITKLGHLQRRFLGVVDKCTYLIPLDYYLCMEPHITIGWGFDWLLILARFF